MGRGEGVGGVEGEVKGWKWRGREGEWVGWKSW